MNREEFQTERTRIISEMLDNPDEYGIYPTTKCFEQLDALFDSLSLPPAEGAEQIASDLSLTIGLLEAEIDSLKDAYKSDGLNSREYSSAILSHKTALKILKGNISQKPLQPTAEGAEEMLLLAKYISQIRVVNDPDIDQLLKLDDLWREVYAEHRIKIGFGEASLIAYAAVIKKVRALHAQKMTQENLREELIDFGHAMFPDESLQNIKHYVDTHLKSKEQ